MPSTASVPRVTSAMGSTRAAVHRAYPDTVMTHPASQVSGPYWSHQAIARTIRATGSMIQGLLLNVITRGGI